MRRPIDNSAALSTWACAPHSTRAMPVGPWPVAGWAKACRAIRRAVTPLQVRAAGAVYLAVMNAYSPRLPTIGHIGAARAFRG
jgi:hypothetical protein